MLDPIWHQLGVQLDRIESKIDALHERFTPMSQALDDLIAQVAASITVEESAITLIGGISARIDAALAAADPSAALADLKAQLAAESAKLAAAVAANTTQPAP